MANRALVAFLIFVVVLGNASGGGAQEPFPVPVFVTHLQSPPLPPLSPDAHEAAISRTKAERFEVAAQLRKTHGDKMKNWPREVWKEFYVAQDASTRAVARRDYQPAETRLSLADSVADFLRGGGNKRMTMVTTPDEASLVVQITGRRRVSSPDPLDGHYFVRFRLAPGAKMPPERFHELTYDYKWDNAWMKLIAHPSDPSPYVDLEAGSPVSWKNAADGVHGAVTVFIHDRIEPKTKKK